MILLRYFDTKSNSPKIGRVENGEVFGIQLNSPADDKELLGYIETADKAKTGLADIIGELPMDSDSAGTVESLNVTPAEGVSHLLPLYSPPEVWAFGVTYKRSAEWRSDDTSVGARIYDQVYDAERPEMFWKGNGTRIVGPNERLGIRSDSTFTATEPELAYVVGSQDNILAYTICNDFSAWDIERDNPLYLPQSKIFTGCCSLGPVLVTPDEVDPYDLDISCTIHRDGEVIFDGTVNSSQIGRKFEALNTCLTLNNPVDAGTVVSTGTGLIVPPEAAHQDGDIVEITIENIGTLRNIVRQL